MFDSWTKHTSTLLVDLHLASCPCSCIPGAALTVVPAVAAAVAAVGPVVAAVAWGEEVWQHYLAQERLGQEESHSLR